MKSIAVCLILIGSLALAAVLSLSMFFLLRPRSRTTTYYFGVPKQTNTNARDVQQQPLFADAPPSTKRPVTVITPSSTESATKSSSATPSLSPSTTTVVSSTSQSASSSVFLQPMKTRASRVTERTLAPIPITQPKVFASLNEEWLVIDVKAPQSDAVPAPSSIGNNQDNNLLVLDTASVNDIQSDYNTAVEYTEPTTQLQFINERPMAHYGKVVGLGYRDGYLYVPSHRQGNISVLATPDLTLIEEIPCPKCRIYDIAILPNGDLIVAQGARKRLAKIDRVSKQIVRELTLSYSTKGLAVSPSGQIFVLSRSHDKVYTYDQDLNEVGIIEFENDNEDCNFLVADTDQGHLLISCQQQVHVVDLTGQSVASLRPARSQAVTYSVGIQQDPATKQTLVVRRGKAQIDVYGQDGQLRDTLGLDQDSLWSDMVVAQRHIYVVDYIHTSIKTYTY